MSEDQDEILMVYEAKGIDHYMSYRAFREMVQLTYHSCGVEGVDLTLLQTAKLIAMQIIEQEQKR